MSNVGICYSSRGETLLLSVRPALDSDAASQAVRCPMLEKGRSKLTRRSAILIATNDERDLYRVHSGRGTNSVGPAAANLNSGRRR